jgi:hypothetical protein
MRSLPFLDYMLCKISEQQRSEFPTTYKRLISSGGYLLRGSLCSPGWCIRCSISRRCSMYTSRESLAVTCQGNINAVRVPFSSTLFNSKCVVSCLYFYVHSTWIKGSWGNKITCHLPEHMEAVTTLLYISLFAMFCTYILYITFYFSNIACIKIAFH